MTDRDPRAFIDMNGGYQTTREGIDKEAHDAWVKTTSWGLSRDDFIRLSYFHGNLEDGDDGRASEKHPINGSTFKPHDVVYINETGGELTRRMVSEWLNDYGAFTHGFKLARASSPPVAVQEAWIGIDERRPEMDEPVLVFNPNGPLHISIDEWCIYREAPVSWSSATIETGEGWANHEFEQITHWMPLPKAPGDQP